MTGWISQDEVHRNQFDYLIDAKRWKNSVITAKTWSVPVCGSDQKLSVCKFQIKLKCKNKANQFPPYVLEHLTTISQESIRNHFDVLNLIDKEPEEL